MHSPHKHVILTTRHLAGLMVAALLSACGGGDGGSDGASTASSSPVGAAAGSANQAKLPARAAALKTSAWVAIPAVADPVLQNLTIPASATTQGMWSGVQNWPLNALHAAVLPNGRVLSYGSTKDGATQDGRLFDLWDPTLGFGTNSHQTTYRGTQQDSFCSAATFLGDGRLMISGGNGSVTSTMYTPATDSVVQSAANMADERWYATMLNLPDGRPVILGGMVPYSEGMQDNPNQAVAQGLASMTPEVFENGAWRSLFGAYSREAFGPDYLRASYPRAWVAPDGRVFGVSAETMWYLDATGNGSITVAGRFKEAPNATTLPNVGATNSAVMHAPGRILVVGGNGSFNGDGLPASNKATVIDINGGGARLVEQPAMTYKRRYPNALVLPNGRVLVTGGTLVGNADGPNAVYAAETWDPVSGTWSVGASAAIYRGYHSFSVLMPNGTVLSTGGGAPGPVTNVNAEVYYPPYLFRNVNGNAQLAPRPVMAAISGLSYANGAALQVDMAAQGTVGQLVLVGLSNGTHSFNAGQRRIPLTFSQDTYRLTTNLPDRNTVPPGYYQLVAIDAAGVPSRGTIIAVGDNVSAPAVPTTPYNPPELAASVAAPVIAAGGTASYSVPATASTTYSWDFGDGSAATAFSASSSAMHVYAQAGVYAVSLTARAADGSVARRNFVQGVGTKRTAGSPNASAATAIEIRTNASARLWTANLDNDSVGVIDTATGARTAEIAVGVSPRSVAVAPDGRIWVVNKTSANISIVNPATLAVVQTAALPRASQPHGLVFAPDGRAFVVLEATGQLLRLDPASGAVQASGNVGANPRHLSVSGDSATVLVSRFITPPLPGEDTATVNTTVAGAEVIAVNPATLAVTKTVSLRHSDKTDTEIQGSGIPNYLAAAVISPDGKSAWVPSKQDNIKRGTLRNGQALDFQNTVRAITSRIDMATLAEDYPKRVDHDNSSLASAAAFHPSGVYLFVALETSRQVAVVDAASGRELFKVDAGRAPQSLSVSADGLRLYVQNFMDRNVGTFDIGPLANNGELRLPLLATVPTIATEKLSAQVLSGKQLFYDARDPRLARDSYMSCASCHSDAGHDGRTWDFTGFGEGLRNTIMLKGRAGIGHGFTHWSANGDEIQDFEAQIRQFAGGTGLMTDAQFNTGTRAQPLGDRKAGLSADLDALAAYLGSLDSFAPSPWRNGDGSLTSAGLLGKSVFANANCASCHAGTAFTISADATALRNIGTLRTASGKRLGGTLGGIDVPTLRDVWTTAPYLHDGRAATLADAVQAHSGTTLGATDLANLVSYLRQIGNEETTAGTGTAAAAAAPPSTSTGCAGENQTCTIPGGSTATVWFGANDKWAVKTGVTGAIACNNAVFTDPIVGTVKSCRYALEVPARPVTNLAPTAALATSYVSPWEKLAAVADGTVPASSADVSGGAYGNWQGEALYGRTDWVSFTWTTPKALSAVEVYWWNDGAGIGTPTAANVEYWTGAAWQPLTAVGLALNTFNRAPLGVTTTRLRIAMKSAKATGILEARVFGSDAAPAANIASTATLSTSYVSPWENLSAVTNGVGPGSSADVAGGAYGNWQGEALYGRTDWVAFTWNTPKALSAFEIYWWNDGAGIGTPTAANVEYWTGTAWQPLMPVGITLNAFNRVDFSVTTTALRVSMKSAKATGILEARAWGSDAPQ
ncbi:galactose oxidase-like domain-containing protein [Variovorax sp. RHLX14]|uniref:galactose oxidase-like domain-containing protein n=1 Tax=Variovorax sp. RHLX14 TaxID=1259731 RepID=UPI003F45B506